MSRMHADRRQILQGLSAAALGVIAEPARAESNPKVVIVGAGMAGLSAAHTLAKRHISFVLVEARDRIGGRAFTDKSLNMPFDQGCAFLHAPRGNPLTPRLAERGLTIAQGPLHPAIYFSSDNDGPRAVKAFDIAFAELERALTQAGQHGDDLAAADLVYARTVYDRLASFALGPDQTGVNLTQLSTLDWYTNLNLNAGRDGRVKDGLGTFVAGFGAGFPVTLSSTVTRIDWHGPNVRVETSTGSIDAEACIITVPVGVLRAGSITFAPTLPAAKQAAIAGIAMGTMNKIALAFRPGALPPEHDLWLYQVRKDGAIADVMMRPFGYDMTVHYTGGDFAREVELLTKADQVQLALSSVTDIYGNDVASGCTGGAVTRWSRDPFSQGSHSAALPGQAHQRSELAKPVADKLFFAGEACASTWASSLPGAFQSGHTAARAIADRLGPPFFRFP
ncbi:MAG: FAD-dependent oxidoreductase [Rhizomicrobium sp.]|jgi:monoamine oxidase